ncbi:MAG: PIN domain-containing protein [Candidatus Omnitrophica bacterium]|nr:PIN domain-containing protein [Candidatus Omnitrophota bacterium]
MNGRVESFLQGKRAVCLDSMVIVYFIEENPAYLPILGPIFNRIDAGTLSASTSFITLTEVLVKPLEKGRFDLAQQYRDRLLGSTGFTLFPVEETISETAARLRARYGTTLRVPDAIQIATAIECGAQAFLTNDEKLSRVQEIEIAILCNMVV